MPRIPSETQESIAFAGWLLKQEGAGLLTFCHIPNEGNRTEREGAIMKRMGLRPGWPDFMIYMANGEDYAIEMKRRNAPVGEPWGVRVSSSHLRPQQAEWFAKLSEMGVHCRACPGAQAAVQWIRENGPSYEWK